MPMKICVIGYAGAGKSSFARKLGELYQIDVCHIDTLQYAPGWVERNPKVRDSELSQVVDKENWIIDGNYSRAVPKRFPDADQLFIFNFNRMKCLYGALVRRIQYHNKNRESMTEGNKERLNFEFIMWILFQSRTKKRKGFYQYLKSTFPDKVITFRKRAEVNAYLLSIGIQNLKSNP